MSETISAIICCYNSVSRIEKTLSALAAQNFPESIQAEAILVDNCSTDGTAELARSVWRRTDMPLRIVAESRAGLCFARSWAEGCVRASGVLLG